MNKKHLQTLTAIVFLLFNTKCATTNNYDFSNYEIKQKGLKEEILKRFKEQDKCLTLEEYLAVINQNYNGNELTYKELSDEMSKSNYSNK